MTDAGTHFLEAFEVERRRLSIATQRGIGMPMAGLLFWLGVAWLTRRFPAEQAALYSFFLTGVVFPIGMLFTRIAGGDLFAKSPGLTPLGALLAALQFFYWPMIILVFNLSPAWTPWVMAVLFGAHFLPYAWLYRSRAYAFLTISVAVSLSALVVIARGPMPTVVPLVTAACYGVAIVWMWRENQGLSRRPTD